MPALETLAVISYKQPVTAPEIQEIRGVNTSGVLKTLLDKRLITTAGRKEVIGRPILYRTSKEFLMRFGLSDLQELPSLKEFEALAREALGSDEGIATPGAGDESVLEGIVEETVHGEAQAQTENAASVEQGSDAQEKASGLSADTPAEESSPVGAEPQSEPAAEAPSRLSETRRRRLPKRLKRRNLARLWQENREYVSAVPLPSFRSALLTSHHNMRERLQKIIARAGIASRRHAEQLILSGQVRVNGRVVTELGTKADLDTDRVEAAGKVITAPAASGLPCDEQAL